MRKAIGTGGILTLGAVLFSSATAQQAGQRPATRVIGGHQIDRYEAVMKVRKALEADPRNVTDWVLLGELSQEVAHDAPPDRAEGYYRLARESFDNALKLQPDNASIRAAAQFATAQEQGAEKFRQSRAQATADYLSIRRRELARSSNAPMLRVYRTQAQPAPAPATAPGYYTYVPGYQPYVGEEGNSYSYQQHYDSFFGPVHPRFPGQVITATEQGALVKPAALAAPP